MESVLKIAWEAKEMEYHPVKAKQKEAERKVRIGVARDRGLFAFLLQG